MLYTFTDEGYIERVEENNVINENIISSVSSIKESGLKELLEEAIALHKSPRPSNYRDATEKIWDAFERMKTYYVSLEKKESVNKIIKNMAGDQSEYYNLLNDEFKALTDIGNNYRIRHHETNKTDITDVHFYDYFFNRCLALIALALQYL